MKPKLADATLRRIVNNFHKALLAADEKARKEIPGYKGYQFQKMLNERHGYDVAKELLRPLPNGRVQTGFADLVIAGRPDLTMEAAVLERQWRRLFNQHEIDEAMRRFRLVDLTVSYLLTPKEAKLVIEPIRRNRPAA